jgi:photosystem II stability/assembly factor-like uncharacterized protein
MTIRADVRGYFEREAARHPVPPGLRTTALAEARGRAFGRRPARGFDRPSLQWASGLVAALIAVAVVAGLLYSRSAVSVPRPTNTGPHYVPPSTPGFRYVPLPTSAPRGCWGVWTPGEGYGAPVPVKMVSWTTGWAAGALRTTDGGAHWLNVAPPTIPDRSSGAAEFYLDASHGWVAEAAASSKACVDHVVVFSTVDGGQTWQESAPISVTVKSALDQIWLPDYLPMGHSLDFVDPQHGWMVVQAGGANWLGGINHGVGALYRTTDGGLHWMLESTNLDLAALGLGGGASECYVNGGVSFVSTETGWMQFLCQGWSGSEGALLVTHDAGTTWQVDQLAGNAACYCEADLPVFFDAVHGIVHVQTPSIQLLATSDGGLTWSPRSLPPTVNFVDFVDPNNGWATDGTPPNVAQPVAIQLYHTSDGGKTWTSIDANLPHPTQGSSPLYFLDANNGFWASGNDLRRTTDGGHSWKVIYP